MSSSPLSPKSMTSPVERAEASAADFVERELAFGEDVQDLAPDIARRPDDRDPITHFQPASLSAGEAAKWARA